MEEQYKFTISVDVIAEDDVEAWGQVVEGLNSIIESSQANKESSLGFDGNSSEMTVGQRAFAWNDIEWSVKREIVR